MRPGLWTDQDIIETFPGDTVLVQGQVSNYIGMRSVEIECDAWRIYQKYELNGKHAKVFNYNYRMPVPEDATFDQELKIIVTDIDGSENKKVIKLTYLPDTQAPVANNDMPWQVGVDFDPSVGYGEYNLYLDVSDDRQLSSATVDIPAIGILNTYDLKGRNDIVADQIRIVEAGNFDMTITLADDCGNEQVYYQQLVVMPAEVEDPISDYPVMWVVNASENPNQYLDGYYSPMMRQDAYQYSGKFYADKDGYQLYIVPEKSMDGDIFGASPYVASKLMNRRGYVVPLTIDSKGYYGIWIDINTHTWSIWSLDTSGAYTGTLTLSGCGFSDFGDWGTPSSPMTRNGYRYTSTVKQNGAYSGTRYYYAADTSTWGYILRWWSDASGCGWWEDTEGSGGNVGTYVSDYDGNVQITFDTAILWATVKKVN